MAIYAYMRVSTNNQTTEHQRAALLEWLGHVDEWFDEPATSGTTKMISREKWQEVIAKVKKGDTLAVYAVDRLGRTASDVLANVEELQRVGVRLKVLREQFDPMEPMGKMMLTMLMAMAEMERNLISSRVKVALENVRKTKKLGRKRTGHTEEVRPQVRTLTEQGKSRAEIAKLLNVSEAFVSQTRREYKVHDCQDQGMTQEQTAEHTGINPKDVKRYWKIEQVEGEE